MLAFYSNSRGEKLIWFLPLSLSYPEVPCLMNHKMAPTDRHRKAQQIIFLAFEPLFGAMKSEYFRGLQILTSIFATLENTLTAPIIRFVFSIKSSKTFHRIPRDVISRKPLGAE